MEPDFGSAETVKHLKAEIGVLRDALSFYANRKHYDLFVRSHPSMGEYETSFIQDDGGQIAREALNDER